MADPGQDLQGLLQRLASRPEVYWLVALVVVLFVVRQVARWYRRPKNRSQGPSPFDIDVQELVSFVQNPEKSSVRVYHVPVRVGLVVIAPLGRDSSIPEQSAVAGLLDKAIPGLGRVLRGQPVPIRIWPVQLSSQGFITSFRRHVKLPGPDAKGTPWSLVAGKVSIPKQGQYMLGFIVCAAEANNVDMVNVESEQQWLDVLRITA